MIKKAEIQWKILLVTSITESWISSTCVRVTCICAIFHLRFSYDYIKIRGLTIVILVRFELIRLFDRMFDNF